MSDSDMPAILVVEDDFFIREQLSEELRTLGFDDIRTAIDLRSGNDALDKGGIALAILDVNLGNDLVFPLADRIAHRRIPIIFCTAMLGERIPEPWSGYPVLKKPLDWSSFDRLVGSWRATGLTRLAPRDSEAVISPRARAS